MNKNQFEKFYQANLDKIFRFVFYRVNTDRELAEDLVSEIFMKALENFERYDDKISASAWLFTIAKNHLANYWRDRKSTVSLDLAQETEDGEVQVELAVVESSAAVSAIRLDLDKYLDQMTAEEREIVTFHYLYGYSYAEIARIHNLTEGAVKVTAHRALKKVRKNI